VSLVRWLGSSFAFFSVGLCIGKNANVLPKALAKIHKLSLLFRLILFQVLRYNYQWI
jgi:hypothetical protein